MSNIMLASLFLSIAFFITPCWRIDSHSLAKRRLRHLQSSTGNPFSPAVSKLNARNSIKDGFFGHVNQVAISENRIVVGALNAGYSFQGAAFLFMDPNDQVLGRDYSEVAIIQASDRSASDWFGHSVDIDGDMIVVGATGDSNQTGAVYVFQILHLAVTQLAKITADNGKPGSFFGVSVAIHGNSILVGATEIYDEQIAVGAGSAYLFADFSSDQNGRNWTQVIQFQPNDLFDGSEFGNSVALDGTTAVVGSWSGNVAYVYEKVDVDNDSSLWMEKTKLADSGSDYFGSSVALAGNWIVVGAPTDDSETQLDVGAVHVFYRNTETSVWSQVTRLIAGDGSNGDQFGFSIAISQNASTIVVGANSEDYGTSTIDCGSAYLFRPDSIASGGWTQTGKFVAPDGDKEDYLGTAIAIESDIVVVGAPADDIASFADAGSVYVLDVDTGFSTLTPTLIPTAKPTNTSTSSPYPPIHFFTPEPTLSSKDPADSEMAFPTTTPGPVMSNTTPEPENDNNIKNSIDLSLGVIIGLAIVVAGLVTALVAYFHYRVKIQTGIIRDQHPGIARDSGNNIADESHPTADVLIMPPSLPLVRTVEAMVISDPTYSNQNHTELVEKRKPHFKDQTRPFVEPGASRQHFQEYAGTNQGIQGADRDYPEEEVLRDKRRSRDPPASTQQKNYSSSTV
jgi:hypothetical protein